jgi:hypothetical protein
MATRSNIGIRTEDNTIKAAYCHWDGYLQNNGVILFDHYQDVDDILDLVAAGSFSSLASTPEETITDERNVDALVDWTPEEIEDTPAAIKEFFNSTDREFLYVYDPALGVWYYAEDTYDSNTDGELKLLEPALKELGLV